MDRKSELHNRIKELRLNRNMTQKQVADFLGVEVSTYAHYEKGDRTPDAKKLKSLAELYELNDEMLGSKFPIESYISYVSEDIDRLKEVLIKCRWVEGDDIHNKFQYEYLREAAKPVLEAREAAMSLPNVNFDSLVDGSTVLKVKLDVIGEALLSRYIREIEKYYLMGGADVMVLKRKIEDRAIGTLESLIDSHPTLDRSKIKKGDKELSWDGFIGLFSNGDTESDKKNFEANIPVQVKGHVDINNEFWGKERISYLVDIDDLNVYFRSTGCLYFIIILSEDGERREIYYCSLYPSKIKSYLETINRKGNHKTYSIKFIRLEPDPYELEILCRQFSTETIYQGFGQGPIVSRSITMQDAKKVKELRFTAVGARTPYEALQRITSGDVVVYGKLNGVDYPMGWGDNFSATLDSKHQESISVAGKEYYNSFDLKSFVTAPGEKKYSKEMVSRIYVSPNLYLEGKPNGAIINMELNTDIARISYDSEFLLDMIKNQELCIGDKKFPFYKTDIKKDFENGLKDLVEVGKTLRDIGCKILIPFPKLTKEDKKQIDILVDLRKGNRRFNTDMEFFVYEWVFRDKVFPVLIEQKKKIRLTEYMFSRTLKISFGSPAEDQGIKVDTLPEDAYLVPNFSLLTVEQLGNLYYYDYESMFDQIETAVINVKTEAVLDALSLKLIGAYDICKDSRLLEIAQTLIMRLLEVFKGAANLKINLLQIEKRLKGSLSEESKEMLRMLVEQTSDVAVTKDEGEEQRVLEFCSAILLDENDKAKALYGQLQPAGKRMVDGLPIMKLYEKHCNTEIQ